MLMPSVAVAGSLERIALSSSPVVERLMLRTSSATTMKHDDEQVVEGQVVAEALRAGARRHPGRSC